MQKFLLFILLNFYCLQLLCGADSESSAQLLLSHQTAKKGETILAGILIKLPKNWHIYWINPGESGAPPQIEWQLPEGISPKEPIFPTPKKHELGGVFSYVIENEAMLIVPLVIGNTTKDGELDLKAKVQWLECKEICRSASANVQAKLQIGKENIPSQYSELIKGWLKNTPATNIVLNATGEWVQSNEKNKYEIKLKIQSPHPISDFFPYPVKNIDFGIPTRIEKSGENLFVVSKIATLMEGNLPDKLSGVITFEKPTPEGFNSCELKDIPVSSKTVSTGLSFSLALLFAFIGGIILNVMPCVLPVISLKILSFVNQSSQEPSRLRINGLLFALGVVSFMTLLAIFVISVQKAGRLAGWGMQFQNPGFIIALTVLVTLIALNLFGLFEVVLGGNVVDKASAAISRKDYLGSFMHGALVVILATPCTAPFLGAALGYAFTQPPAKILLTFISIGIGLSLPFTLASMFPPIVKLLPKPGAWMERFKILLGFPMLATAVWLLSIAFAHYGEKAIWLGIFLVILSMCVWMFGEYYQRNRKPIPGLIIPLIILIAGYYYTLEYEMDWRNPIGSTASSVKHSKYGIDWLPWSPEAVEKARSEGKMVLVDFTADWCLTCQANMKTSIDIPEVSKKLKETGALAFLADYTRGDERISAELRKYNRAGVPLVIVYPADTNKPPIILPELLTPSIVLEALESAAGKQFVR